MKFARRALYLALIALAAILLFHQFILGKAFDLLVDNEPPVKSDIAVVLAGDGWGNRILKGGEMVRQGYAPVALVSGPVGFYDTPECEFAIPFAVRHGYPESYFEHFHGTVNSTEDEKRGITAELNRRGLKSILLVTSGFHTARAARIFRNNSYGIAVHVVAAPDPDTDNGNWYRNREGRKKVLIEWIKTVTGPFGF